MTIQDRTWDTIRPTASGRPTGLLRSALVTPRPHGALRFECPITGSFVLVTDDDTLPTLRRPFARLRCPSCGEMHLLTQSGQTGGTAIVADNDEP